MPPGGAASSLGVVSHLRPALAAHAQESALLAGGGGPAQPARCGPAGGRLWRVPLDWAAAHRDLAAAVSRCGPMGRSTSCITPCSRPLLCMPAALHARARYRAVSVTRVTQTPPPCSCLALLRLHHIMHHMPVHHRRLTPIGKLVRSAL